MKTSLSQPGATIPFMQPLAARLSLTPDEIPIFQTICLAKSVRKGQDIAREGQENRAINFLLEGSCIYYRIMGDGQRHIVNILISGDIFGPNCFFDEALYSVRTLTDAVIVTWQLGECLNLLGECPRLATKILWSLCCDATVCAERVVVMGMPARQRIAHFLLELLSRSQAAGLADERSYRIAFGQKVISDVLGLSRDHVSRELRRMAREGLVEVNDQVVQIGDIKSLIALASFKDGYLQPTPIGKLLRRTGHR